MIDPRPTLPDRALPPRRCAPRVDDVEVLEEIVRIARDELELERPATELLARAAYDGRSLAEAKLADLALDSLSRTVLAVALEDRFAVRLEDADAEVATLGELARRVASRACGDFIEEET